MIGKTRMSALSRSVALYRLLESDGINESTTVKKQNVSLSSDIIHKIIDVWESSDYPDFGLEVRCGSQRYSDISKKEELKKLRDELAEYIEINFQRTSCFIDINDFIKRCNSLSHGIIPSSFFIADINYLRGEEIEATPDVLLKIENFCALINLLKKTCHFVDNKEDAISSKAVFVITDEDNKSMKPVYIDLSFTQKLLTLTTIDLRAIREIVEDDIGKTHKEEQLSTFRVSVWEILTLERNSTSDLYSLITYWDELLEKYFASYELYIRGFSFTKFQNEVHEYLVDSANKANELVGTLANKVAIVPSLFGVWLLAIKEDEPNIILSLGLVLIAVFALAVVIMVLDNQHFMIKKILDSSAERFDLLKRKAHSNTELIKQKNLVIDSFIDRNNRELTVRLIQIKRRLIAIRLSAWAFVLAMFWGVCITFWPYSTPLSSIFVFSSLSIACGALIISACISK
ncbi:hypothetical protein GCM10011274_36930 [Paraglaciecola chathamensis]|uniref:Uncharacterized protein n=2 Tax=Paraglaciecola chathamensis TaxID=368405 RepID=A0A8H9M1S9_9ALTE|nr:hypothetical protein GCM10011274_36930 [Paraglaciecola oceanifecundans]